LKHKVQTLFQQRFNNPNAETKKNLVKQVLNHISQGFFVAARFAEV